MDLAYPKCTEGIQMNQVMLSQIGRYLFLLKDNQHIIMKIMSIWFDSNIS